MSDLESELGVMTPSAGQLNNIEACVNKAVELSREIEQLETLLKALKAECHALTTNTLPDIMAASGTTAFKTVDGVSVTVKPFMSGSLPKEPEKHDAAISWLKEHDGEHIIKALLIAEFAREGNQAERNMAAEALKKLGVEFREVEDVHHSTLAAWARERTKHGEEVDLKLLGLHSGRAAKIELPEE